MSVTVFLVLAVAGYAGWEYARVMFRRQEGYRVLEETGSVLAARRALYRDDARERDALRKRMVQQLREVGITDPDAQTWIEVADVGAHDEARLGVVYTGAFHWPLDVFAPIERDIQIEHTLSLPR